MPEILEWKYQRNNSMLKRHHVYICPKCDREVEVKENFCPRCGGCFSKSAYKKYHGEE